MLADQPSGRAVPLGEVLDDRSEKIAPVAIVAAALNRNTLVTGLVGSGKSTTCKR